MTALTTAGRRTRPSTVLPPPPTTPRSLLRLAVPAVPDRALLTSSACVILAQACLRDPQPGRAAVRRSTRSLFLVYQAVSLPVNFTGRSFDLAAHVAARQGVAARRLPVGGHLPADLRRADGGAAQHLGGRLRAGPRLSGRRTVYVLDDGPGEQRPGAGPVIRLHLRAPAQSGHHKKAGNLNYALGRTGGEHVVIFDADFRPRPDFLAETLPYMDDPRRRDRADPAVLPGQPRQTWVEQAAGATLEVFYRAVQVSRDRFGSALCVGSNAVYRRAALDAAGGFTEIPYAEDSHTGLDMRYPGYDAGLPARSCWPPGSARPRSTLSCASSTAGAAAPPRWSGRTTCGGSRCRWRSRLPYIAGWLWNLTTGLRTLIAAADPDHAAGVPAGRDAAAQRVLLIPVVITGTVIYPLWHNVRCQPHIWPLAIAVGWAQALAIWDYARGKVMSWQPCRGPGDATRRFRKACGLERHPRRGLAALAVWRISQTLAEVRGRRRVRPAEPGRGRPRTVPWPGRSPVTGRAARRLAAVAALAACAVTLIGCRQPGFAPPSSPSPGQPEGAAPHPRCRPAPCAPTLACTSRPRPPPTPGSRRSPRPCGPGRTWRCTTAAGRAIPGRVCRGRLPQWRRAVHRHRPDPDQPGRRRRPPSDAYLRLLPRSGGPGIRW